MDYQCKFEAILEPLLDTMLYQEATLSNLYSSFGCNYMTGLMEFRTVGFVTPRESGATSWLIEKVAKDKKSLLILPSKFHLVQIEDYLTLRSKFFDVSEVMSRVTYIDSFILDESFKERLGPDKIVNIYVDDASRSLNISDRRFMFYDVLSKYKSFDFTIVLVK